MKSLRCVQLIVRLAHEYINEKLNLDVEALLREAGVRSD